MIDDDLVLSKTKLQRYCTAKGIDYETMTEFEIPYGYKKIHTGDWSGTFTGMTHLEKVTLPETIETIGNYSFQNCTSLKNINLPKSLKSINRGAFDNCSRLTKITIPGSMESIGVLDSNDYGAFQNCTGLEELIIEEGVKTIGNFVFKECTSLKTINKDGTLPKSLTSIGKGAFYYCASLERIKIPGSVESIGELMTSTPTYYPDGSFHGCTGLKEIIIEEGVKTIGCRAFCGTCYINGETRYNTSIEKITIPKSVVTVDYEAFRYYVNLKEVIFEGEIKDKEGKVMPIGESNCETIGYFAFGDSKELTNITLPRTKISPVTEKQIETKIEYGAFETVVFTGGCPNVTSLTIPGNIKEIGDYAFEHYPNLANLIIEEGVEKIGGGVFATSSDHYPIRKLVIPSTVTEIGQYAFYHFATYCSATDPFACVFKSETATFSSYYMFSSASYVKTFVPESAIYDYYEKVSSSYYLGVEGKNTVLLKPASGNDIWFDTNGNGIKDEGERDYCFFAIEPGATDDATFDTSLLPKPIETGKTSPGIIQWLDSSANVVKQIKNPKGGGEITTLYANIISGISLDSLTEKDISISYNGTEKTLSAPEGFTLYKWFIDGKEVEQSETSRTLSFASLTAGSYKVVVFTQDSKGDIYSASYNLKI